MLKLWKETRFLNPRDNHNINIYNSRVGWVEVTKPNSTKFCWAVPEGRRRAVTAIVEGFRYRETQPTIAEK